MPIELMSANWQMVTVALTVGVPSFFLGWFAHGLWEGLISPPGKDKG